MGKHLNKIVATTLMGALLFNNCFCMASGNEATIDESEKNGNTSSVSKKSSLWWWATLPIALFSTILYKLHRQKESSNENLDNDQNLNDNVDQNDRQDKKINSDSDDSYNLEESDYSGNDQISDDNEKQNDKQDEKPNDDNNDSSSENPNLDDNLDNDQNSDDNEKQDDNQDNSSGNALNANDNADQNDKQDEKTNDDNNDSSSENPNSNDNSNSGQASSDNKKQNGNQDNSSGNSLNAKEDIISQNANITNNLNQSPQNLNPQFNSIHNQLISDFVDNIKKLTKNDIDGLAVQPESMSIEIINSAKSLDDNVGDIMSDNQNLSAPEIKLLSGIAVTALSITGLHIYHEDRGDENHKHFLENYLLAEICRLKAELTGDNKAMFYDKAAGFYDMANNHPYGSQANWSSERCTNALSAITCRALSKKAKGQNIGSDIESIHRYFDSNKNSIYDPYKECYGTQNCKDTLRKFISTFVNDPGDYDCLYAIRDCATLICL